jgi:peptidyl-prolyl cis-trans isomerase D
MAVIGYIRKHSAIAVILVGISLVAFLVGPNLIDWAKNVLGYSSGPGSKREVGIVNDQSISLSEFEGLTLKNAEQVKINQQKADLSSEEIFNLKDQTWNQRVNEIIMGEEYGNLGITISADEMIDQLRGNDPHRMIRQYFVNESGQYDPNLVVQYMQNLSQMSPQDRLQWESFKEYIYTDRLANKYRTLISKGYYIPRALAEMEYKNNADIAEIRYVGLKYADVSDSLVPEPTERDYKEYYEANKQKYTQSATRDIDYVVFNILPSESDLRAIEEEAAEIFSEWIAANDPGEYVNNVPGNRYDSSWIAEGTLSLFIDSAMFNGEIGTFVEPYKEGGAWHMARLMDRQLRPDSASAEHVLISYQGAYRADPANTRSKEAAALLADSLYNVLSRDASKFQEIAVAMSDDGSVANNMGDLGWFADGNMIPAFNEAAIMGKKGDVTVVETPFGFHILHVKDITPAREKVRVAQIELPIEYSTETYESYYSIAARFAGENNTAEKFEQAVIDEGLDKREATYVREMQMELPSMKNTRQVIRWLYWDNTEIGDVSHLFDLGGSFVVALYKDKKDEGTIPLEDIKERIASNVINELKAKYLTEKITALGTTDIYAIANAFDARVDTSSSITFNSRNLPGYATENEIIGSLFTYQAGENTGPVKGNAGVFVINIDKIYDAPALDNYNSYTSQKLKEFEQRVGNNFIFIALENAADIKDYRRYFY